MVPKKSFLLFPKLHDLGKVTWYLEFFVSKLKKKKKSEAKEYLFPTCRFTLWVKGDMYVLWRPRNEATIKYTSECEWCILERPEDRSRTEGKDDQAT